MFWATILANDTSKDAISLTTQADNYIYLHYVWLGIFFMYFSLCFYCKGSKVIEPEALDTNLRKKIIKS